MSLHVICSLLVSLSSLKTCSWYSSAFLWRSFCYTVPVCLIMGCLQDPLTFYLYFSSIGFPMVFPVVFHGVISPIPRYWPLLLDGGSRFRSNSAMQSRKPASHSLFAAFFVFFPLLLPVFVSCVCYFLSLLVGQPRRLRPRRIINLGKKLICNLHTDISCVFGIGYY